MALTKINVITREFYRIPVEIKVDGLPIDPSALPIQFAIVPVADGDPGDSDWIGGTWETVHHPSVVYLARVLVGDAQADVTLVKGTQYNAWLRITDTPERPARVVGQILGS